jgi:hypothetical protein
MRDGVYVTSEAKHRAIFRAYSNWDGNPKSITEMARAFGMSEARFNEYKRIHRLTHSREPFPDEEIGERDLDEMAEEVFQARRDALWQKAERKKWQETKKAAERMWHLEQTLLAELRDIDQIRPAKLPRLRISDEPSDFSVICHPTDLHVGKYGERGDGIEKCRENLWAAASDVFAKVSRYGQPASIIAPIGGDMHHTDSSHNVTTRGTKQDVTGNYHETVADLVQLIVDWIEMLRAITPRVIVPVVPGNHDRDTTAAVGACLVQMYRDAADVDVMPYAYRHYLALGSSMVMIAHGDGAKPKDYPTIMAAEAPDVWGNTDHRYAFHGHLHHERITEFRGVSVIQMPSLAGADDWHRREGWIGSRQQLAAYLIDHRHGKIGIFYGDGRA